LHYSEEKVSFVCINTLCSIFTILWEELQIDLVNNIKFSTVIL